MTFTNNRKYAATSIELIDKLNNIISEIDNGKNIDNFTDNIEITTIKLGNALKKIEQNLKKTAVKNFYSLRSIFAHRDGSEQYDTKKDYEIWKQKFNNLFPELLPDLQKIASKCSNNKKKRDFETAKDRKFGDEDNRKRIIDAMEDAFDNETAKEEKAVFPPKSDIVKKTVDELDSYQKHYVSTHDGLLENVQTDILEWANDTQHDIEFECIKHFAEEKLYIDKISKLSPQDFYADIKNIEQQYNTLQSVENEFNMQKYLDSYNSEVKEKGEKKSTLYAQRYFQALLQSLTENFNARKAAFEQKLIDEKRKQFLKELYEKIENFKKLEQLLQPFIDDLGHGYLWDMSNSPFRSLGFDILKKYSELLKNDTVLQEFAELLGKQSVTSQEVEKQIIDETIIKSEYHPKPAQSGNIVGFEYSNDISRVLPPEVGLLNDSDLENLFYFKFVEKQLLSYRYSQDVASTYEEIRKKEIEVSKSKDLTGPIIICVDTSGSMQGTPEQTAKIATFALAKISIKQHRKCFLISFSTGIETLDMSDFKKTNALETLVGFLNKSFNGGTDASPALRECLRQLKTENYQNSDVLMISDFVMNSLPPDVVSSIKTEQGNGTSFYSLVIGESANNQAIECFDENISYNPYNEVSRQEFYRKIRELTVKKNKDNEQ